MYLSLVSSFIVLSLLINLTLVAVVGQSYDQQSNNSTLNSFNEILGGFGALLTAQKAVNLIHPKYTEKWLRMIVFVGYDTYNSLMVNKLHLTSDEQVTQFVTSYVDQIKYIYRHKSLGGTLFIDLVDIVIHKSNDTLKTWNGDRDKLLNEFCDYQKDLPNNDSWDLALYLTSLNLYYITESGFKDYDALGISPIGGICQKANGCVIAELGPVLQNVDVSKEKIYPSGGFASAWIAAHEIAHNLGIFHDGEVNHCPNNLFLMSGSRGHIGKNVWSPCSANHFSLLNLPCLMKRKSKLHDSQLDKTMKFNVNSLPGALYDVHEQCKYFFGQFNARAVNVTGEICSKSVYCSHESSTGNIITIATSPALEGTICATDCICLNAICTKIPSFH